MPVKIPDGLPAAELLALENIFVIPAKKAFRQDIRPLKIAIYNIMPQKERTETQLVRLLSYSPLQVDITLLHTSSYSGRNTAPEHLARFYKTFEEVREKKFDILIITGAPVETMEFRDVDYWDELCFVMEWSKTNVHTTLHICWGAQAGLFYHFGVPKHSLGKSRKKMFGVFSHTHTKYQSPLLHGFDDVFFAPHSRHTEVRNEDLAEVSSLCILSESQYAGIYIVCTANHRQVFIMGHPEYDITSLQEEYVRDVKKGLDVPIPCNYFPSDDPSQPPVMSWRGHASLLISNLLNHVYQETPYDLGNMEPID